MGFPDLTALQMPPFIEFSNLIAVGWLEPGHDYRRGEVDAEFVGKLADLLVDPWQPAIAMGRHQCGFCRLTGGPTSIRLTNPGSSSVVQVGVTNVWIPADGFLYVAPSLVLHYIDAHGYSPPLEFQAAVMACPPMRQMDYLKAILKNGPKGIVTK
jgi:hypothetical protein